MRARTGEVPPVKGAEPLSPRARGETPHCLKKRVFSFWFFFSFARKEEKKKIGVKCNYYSDYSGFTTKAVSPLFFLTKKAQKEKFQKKNAAKKFRSLR